MNLGFGFKMRIGVGVRISVEVGVWIIASFEVEDYLFIQKTFFVVFVVL